MIRIAIVFVCLTGAAHAQSLDFTDYEAVCAYTLERIDTPRDDFLGVCTCAYGAIESVHGTAFTANYARWETGHAALADILPDGTTEDTFFAMIEETHPAMEDQCAAFAPKN